MEVSGYLRLSLNCPSGREVYTDVTAEGGVSQPVTQRNAVKTSLSLNKPKEGLEKLGVLILASPARSSLHG